MLTSNCSSFYCIYAQYANCTPKTCIFPQPQPSTSNCQNVGKTRYPVRLRIQFDYGVLVQLYKFSEYDIYMHMYHLQVLIVIGDLLDATDR